MKHQQHAIPRSTWFASLAIALDLAATGLPVFPCTSRKTPAIAKAKGGNGFHDASRDPVRILALWVLAGDAAVLVGVPTGSASGLDVLDIDPRHGGHLWEAEHAAQLVETRIHRTMSGGRHWLFAHAEGVTNSAGKIAPGVDTRGEGGYIVMPPSRGYTVIHDVEVAEWPAWLLPLVLKATDGNGAGAAKAGNGSAHTELRGAANASVQPDISDKRIAGQIAALLNNVRCARDGAKHFTLLRNGRALGGYVSLAGWSDEQAIQALIKALPNTVKNWKLARRTAAWAVAEGKKKPSTLPDRPYEGRARL